MTAYATFVSAVRMGNTQAVWHLLSPDAQQETRRRLKLSADASEAEVLARLTVRPGWGFEIDQTRWAKAETRSATRRLIHGTFNGREQTVPVIQVNGGWRVDLFAKSGPS